MSSPTYTVEYVEARRVRTNLLLSAPAQYRDQPAHWVVLRDGEPMVYRFATEAEAEAFAQSQREYMTEGAESHDS